MKTRSNIGRLVITLIAAALLPGGSAFGVLILTVNTYTTDELSFSISGTFEADTTSDNTQAGYLGIKNDWSNNIGTHTELFSGLPTITLNTILIGGLTPAVYLQGGTNAWEDGIYWGNPLGSDISISEGTSVSGSVTLSGVGMFNPADISTLELVSGFASNDDYTRLEATASAIPELSSSTLLLGLGSLALMMRRRLNKSL